MAKNRPAGRPAKKITSKTTEKICSFLRSGLPYDSAARLAGVAPRTFHRWKAKGKQAKSGQYWQFWQEIEKAVSAAEAIHVRNITQAATEPKTVTDRRTIEKADGTVETVVTVKEIPPDWGASKFILSKRFPETWGSKKAIEISTEGGKPLPIQILNEDVDVEDL